MKYSTGRTETMGWINAALFGELAGYSAISVNGSKMAAKMFQYSTIAGKLI